MKYCPEIVEAIGKEIENGSSQKDAAILCGIHKSTYHEWINDENKPEFSDRIEKAHSIYKKKLVQRIQKASDSGTWQAGAWLLERRYNKEFAVRKEVDNNVKIDRIELDID